MAIAAYADIVQRAIDSFDPPLRCPQGNEEAENEMKGRIICRAAYWINKDDPSVGLLSKPGGNNYKGLSTDIMIDRVTGSWADYVSSREFNAELREPIRVFSLGAESSDDPVWLARWRQPTRELAGLDEVDPPPPPPPPPEFECQFNPDAVFSALGEMLAKQDKILALLKENEATEYAGTASGSIYGKPTITFKKVK